ncbi:glycosyltransferase family 2 protein [Paraburkholderia phenoliruptrix]|uniref:glycosyltransferase family 2 protein n=1 Tax=Paraburkholderia phenoliruptrix TaxID=252970 RepID=UPI001C6E3927|nr:glycosyltransferase family 2 protein [Paraburkholderia phenoliruptrix]MBW9106389.1 glycosyltransferase family 2 protein [Paraburkholderia phenoliruptrix]MBW9131038.1 glycosyltransferase family 2 protein [Paraburkholderia ginsengiterrae]
MTPDSGICIVIPCYNGAATLARALQSCSRQPEAAQIIVVDDASTDASAQLVVHYARLDPRVQLLRMPENGGAARARNWGALHASHDLLAFLDADDEYLPGALGAARAFFAHDPAQVSVRFDVDYAGFPAEICAHPDFAQHAATLSNTVPSSLVVRRAAFAALGGFPMDQAFRRLGGEDGAFSWALREVFGNPRLHDAKRVRMHYHPGIHAERYFRIAFGWLTPDPADVADAFCFSQRFLDRARAGIGQVRRACVAAEAAAQAAGGAPAACAG